MAAQRNWNPQIGPAVAHVTETQIGGSLPTREVNPQGLRPQRWNPPGGSGIRVRPLGYGTNEDPISIWGGGRGNGRRQGSGRAQGGNNFIAPMSSTDNSTTTTNVFNVADDPSHRLTNVRNLSGQSGYGKPVLDVAARELPGAKALAAGGRPIIGRSMF